MDESAKDVTPLDLNIPSDEKNVTNKKPSRFSKKFKIFSGLILVFIISFIAGFVLYFNYSDTNQIYTPNKLDRTKLLIEITPTLTPAPKKIPPFEEWIKYTHDSGFEFTAPEDPWHPYANGAIKSVWYEGISDFADKDFCLFCVIIDTPDYDPSGLSTKDEITKYPLKQYVDAVINLNKTHILESDSNQVQEVVLPSGEKGYAFDIKKDYDLELKYRSTFDEHKKLHAIITEHRGYKYLIYYPLGNETSEKILSTFNFIKDPDFYGWKTYEDPDGKVSYEYPSMWPEGGEIGPQIIASVRKIDDSLDDEAKGFENTAGVSGIEKINFAGLPGYKLYVDYEGHRLNYFTVKDGNLYWLSFESFGIDHENKHRNDINRTVNSFKILN